MADPLLTVSIVVYRTPVESLVPLFDSLSSVRSDHVCVVDNAGDPMLAPWLQARGLNYICAENNGGYGSGHNLGFNFMADKRSRYHLVVNPDVHFDPSVLPALIEFMEMHPDVGLLMPDIRYPDGKRQHLCKLLPTPLGLVIRRFFPASGGKSSKSEDRYELRRWGYDTVADIPSLSGCFMFVRSEAFMAVGGFDQRYFMYMEDVDLCRQIGQRWRTVFYPEVHVTHSYAKGSYRSKRLLKSHVVSAVRYFNKWGWFFDRERDKRNTACLKALDLHD